MGIGWNVCHMALWSYYCCHDFVYAYTEERDVIMLRKLAKGIAILLLLIVILLAALFIAMSIFNSPTYAWRILRYGQSDIRDTAIFPERVVLR